MIYFLLLNARFATPEEQKISDAQDTYWAQRQHLHGTTPVRKTPLTKQPVQIIEQNPQTKMFEGQTKFDEASVKAMIRKAAINTTSTAQGLAGIQYATTTTYGAHKPITDHYAVFAQSTEGPIVAANVTSRYADKLLENPPGSGNYFINNGGLVLGETFEEYYKRAQRFYNMQKIRQTVQSQDGIGIFTEMIRQTQKGGEYEYNHKPVKYEFVGGAKNASRLNVPQTGDVGIYWGSGYRSVKSAIDPLKVAQHTTVTGQTLDKRVGYAKLTYRGRKPTNVYGFHGWFVNDTTKQKNNVEDIKKLLERIINHFKGERVVLGGDMNLDAPELARALAQLQFPHHNVIVHILRGYSDISWSGPGFQTPHFGNVDILIEAVPLT